MKVKNIISKRGYRNESSWQLVFEWENILSKQMELPIKVDSRLSLGIKEKCNKFKLQSFYNCTRSKEILSLQFVMTVSTDRNCELNRSVIPIIIDFWLTEKNLPTFYQNYKNVPFLLISSAEVYKFLIDHDCPLKCYHWPLSFPDYYRISGNEQFDKKWDLVLIGRSNPYFSRYLDEYCKLHPDFVYVYGTSDINNRHFTTNTGEYVGDAIGRENYMKMIQSAKIVFYSTPGCDEAKEDANGYNQVTPRFFEIIANGCHVMAHYTNNPDTEYYEISKFSDDIASYEQFEKTLDQLRIKDPLNMKYCSDYLSQHYTSCRVNQLLKILNDQGVQLKK
jgi:hypothetical protein